MPPLKGKPEHGHKRVAVIMAHCSRLLTASLSISAAHNWSGAFLKKNVLFAASTLDMSLAKAFNRKAVTECERFRLKSD